MPNPWDIPPRPTKGDQTEDAIFTEVGRCMAKWEVVEHDLAEMFAAFTGCAEPFGPYPAMRAYGTIVSFRSRCDMLAAAALAFFKSNPNDELEAELKRILVQANGWSNRRNDAAHGIVLKWGDDGFVLLPSLYNSKKYSIVTEVASYVYSSVEIRTFALRIFELSEITDGYRVRLQIFVQAILSKSAQREGENDTHPPQSQSARQ